MTDRRALLAVGGSIVGIVGGTVAAANGAPLPGALAALGAVAAACGTLLSPSDPRDTADGGAPADASADSAAPDATGSVPADVASAGETTDGKAAVTVDRSSSAVTVDVTSPSNESPTPASDDPPEVRPETRTPAPPPNDGAPLLTDPTTGLFSEDYFDIAIEARMAAARRHLRPVGVVLLEVVEGMRSGEVRPTDPLLVAEAVRETLREADTACRRQDGHFALLLEDTPENGAIWTVERIRRRLVDSDPTLTVWAGVACYPAHAFDKESILRAAESALVAARDWHQDRIEVAVGE